MQQFELSDILISVHLALIKLVEFVETCIQKLLNI